jgi:hypothetical protein
MTNKKNDDLQSIDLSSLMELTSSLMKNEALLNSVAGLELEKQSAKMAKPKASQKKSINLGLLLFNRWKRLTCEVLGLNPNKEELAAISRQLEKIANDLAEIKQQKAELAASLRKNDN